MTKTAMAAEIDHAAHSRDLDTLEIALTEDEIANATILQFDPDAVLPERLSALNDPAPTFFGIPGHCYSHKTWWRLAAGAVGGRPADALPRFLKMRARTRD